MWPIDSGCDNSFDPNFSTSKERRERDGGRHVRRFMVRSREVRVGGSVAGRCSSKLQLALKLKSPVVNTFRSGRWLRWLSSRISEVSLAWIEVE